MEKRKPASSQPESQPNQPESQPEAKPESQPEEATQPEASEKPAKSQPEAQPKASQGFLSGLALQKQRQLRGILPNRISRGRYAAATRLHAAF